MTGWIDVLCAVAVAKLLICVKKVAGLLIPQAVSGQEECLCLSEACGRKIDNNYGVECMLRTLLVSICGSITSCPVYRLEYRLDA